MTTPPFKIGEIALRPDRVNSEFLSSLKKGVEKSSVDKGREEATKVLDTWAETQEIAPEDYQKLQTYAGQVGKKFGELKSQWWKAFKATGSEADTRDIEENMGREGALLFPNEVLQTELREATARSAIQALSGSLMGPAGVAAAYAAYSNGPTWDAGADRRTAELLEKLESVSRGDSRMITEGNSVGQVHRAELWKTMNSMLDDAIARGKDGRPTELGIQYYELTSPRIIGKIADAAKAGNKVRINLDPGRLSFPSRDSEGDSFFSLDSTPDKLRTVIQLASLKNADIAVSLFPAKKELNSPSNLMHRKVLRVGDRVLVSGMNANVGSGDNIDAGYTLRGPAARQVSENLARDLQNSKGASLEDIWGEQHVERFRETNLRLGRRGFETMFDALSGPTPAGTEAPKAKSLSDMEALAKKAGATLSQLVEVPKSEYEAVMTKVVEGRDQVQLSKKGKELLKGLIDKTISLTQSEENVARLEDISLASGRRVGETRVDIADLPVEREAAAIQAIAQAEEFIYLPGFVVTKAIASAIVARRDEMLAKGQELDVRVIADSGIYPYGGTPNSFGIKHLEDNGIAPRWSKLERTGSHDRKIHAKQLITDKGELTGSTNFSNKGMRDNWETSAYIHFDENDERALRERENAKSQFDELWTNSYELNSRDLSAYFHQDRPEVGRDWIIEEDRDRAIRQIIRMLFNYERQSANLIGSLVEAKPAVAEMRDALYEEGYSRGDATLKAVNANVGADNLRKLLDEMPTAKSLKELQDEVQQWKKDASEGSESASRAGSTSTKKKSPMASDMMMVFADSSQESLAGHLVGANVFKSNPKPGDFRAQIGLVKPQQVSPPPATGSKAHSVLLDTWYE